MKRSHLVIIGLIVAVLLVWLLFVRPRVVGGGSHSPEYSRPASTGLRAIKLRIGPGSRT